MSPRLLGITIFCLVYLVTQGSTAQIKTIRQITYDEDHYEPYHHQKKVKKNFKKPSTCNYVYHDEQLPEILFYQLGDYLIGDEVAPHYRKKEDDLPALDPRLRQEDDNLPALDPRLIKFFNDVIGQSRGQNTSPALDPRLKSSDSGKNPPPENPKSENPALDPRLTTSNGEKSPSPVEPTPENPSPENPSPENPTPENPTPENPPETEPVITPEQWAEFIDSLTPGS